MSALRRIAEVFGNMEPIAGLGDRFSLHKIRSRWTELTGPQLARAAQPVKLEGGTLIVRVRSGVWKNELVHLSEELLGKINQALAGEAQVTQVRFFVGPLRRRDAEDPAAPRTSISPGKVTQRQEALIRRAAGKISDPGLSEKADRALRVCARRRTSLLESGWRKCVRCGGLAEEGARHCFVCVSELGLHAPPPRRMWKPKWRREQDERRLAR